MAQVSSRFTPEQVLDAGQRAESDGHLDYAVQFYRHLTDYHPGTAEAEIAADALARLEDARNHTAEPPIPFSAALRRSPAGGAGPTASRPPQTRYGADYAGTARGGGDQASQQRAAQLAAQRAVEAKGWPYLGDTGQLPDVIARQPPPAVPLPAPVNGWRVGRSIAVMFAVLGWLLIASGLAAIGLGMVVGVDTSAVTGYSGIVTGPVLIVAGVAVVFWSQLASAIFATANATRDLAQVERAKAERGGQPRG